MNTVTVLRDKILDKHFPFSGPCGFCGHPDKRHRLWDSILARWECGDMVKEIMREYVYTEEAIHRVIELRPYKKP